MNIFTDVLFLFVYIVTMLYFELPNVKNKDYPIHKLYIFISIFGYYYVIQLIKKIKNKCKVDPYTILQDALMMGLYCVLGYSMYVDFLYWDQTKSMFGNIKEVSITKRYAIIGMIIVAFVTMIQLSKMLFKTLPDDCGGTSGSGQSSNYFF